ncbi:MAG: valine--tRNA ligase [Deltaproteobacteria bacterium]|jgi:valyl-tRNA synthetase|nr:valine--tRNA ligase [Deltaproteobacteria bacterium]
MTELLDKNFNPAEAEPRLYESWEKSGLFSPDPAQPGESFVIVIPPPNVTGNLHMGHALDNTLQDILIRVHRLMGDNALWVPGTDHAGIATQAVVERSLAQEGLTKEGLGREEFVARVWRWKERYGGNIVQQLRRLGASCDWTRERFTLDEGLSRAVREAFVSLYEEGLVVRDDYLVNWCPRCLTAVSDIEVEHETRLDSLYYLHYPAEDGGPPLTVATTRPETLFGDAAVAVAPDDPRHAGRLGGRVRIPLTDRLIPVLADAHVDPQFGTGALKVTPAHDPNDFQIGLRHGLPRLAAIDQRGRMTALAGPYEGLDRFECRRRMLTDLEAQGLLARAEPLSHAVGVCYRCRTVIEPLVSRQWFVKTAPLAAAAAQAVRDGRIKLTPASWEKTFFDWMDNIRDWCVSRQLWWGHQIPAWHCRACGRVVVTREDPDLCPDCRGPLERDPDVLDTWFSSGLWPFSTLGWPDDTADLRRYYPTTVLVTGFDILFFWVARMMMLGLKMTGQVPFRTVVLHPLVRDAQGQKMSKSRGNVVDPLEIIARHGADAFRFALASQAGQNRDLKLSPKRIEGCAKFVNKLWNAARFALSNLEGQRLAPPARPLALPDRWIRSRLRAAAAQCRQAALTFEFDKLAELVYRFTWDEFCDWHLELVKPILHGADPEARDASRRNLLTVLADLLTLAHPLMPFVTEELWSKLPGAEGLLAGGRWPEPREADDDPEAERLVGFLMDVVRAARQARADFGVPPARKLSPVVKTDDPALAETLTRHAPLLTQLMGAADLRLAGPDEAKPKEAAANILTWGEVWTPLAGHVDPAAEIARLGKEADKLDKDLKAARQKLGNPAYVDKAPPELVEETKERLADLERRQTAVARTLELVRALER